MAFDGDLVWEKSMRVECSRIGMNSCILKYSVMVYGDGCAAGVQLWLCGERRDWQGVRLACRG
jgi:hypothetical protein